MWSRWNAAAHPVFLGAAFLQEGEYSQIFTTLTRCKTDEKTVGGEEARTDKAICPARYANDCLLNPTVVRVLLLRLGVSCRDWFYRIYRMLA